MENTKLSQNEYELFDGFLVGLESYEDVATCLLDIASDTDNSETGMMETGFFDLCTEKFGGNLGVVLTFIKQKSSIKKTATCRGVLKLSGDATREIDESEDPDDIDWGEIIDESQLQDVTDAYFESDGEVYVETSITMVPYTAYEESLGSSIPEKEDA